MITKLKLPSQDYLKECFEYNEETGELTWRVRPLSHFREDWIAKRWNGKLAGKIAGTYDKKGYVQIKINKIFYKKHRLIWVMFTGSDPGDLEIDHINLIKDDNRFENLRLATGSENACNQKARVTNVSGAKGVSFDKETGKWRASVMKQGVIHHLGRFKTIALAEEAVRKARSVLHGQFNNS